MYKQTQSKDTQLFGTEGFASPEQYGFSQTTEKSDIYSLGKTIHKILQMKQQLTLKQLTIIHLKTS